LVARSQVVVALLQAGGAVDQFPDDVCVPGVPIGLGDHVDQDPVQSHCAVFFRPPWHVADRVQRQRVDRGVRVCPHPVVEPDDLLARFVGGSPHVRIRFGVVLDPGKRLVERAAEGVAEIPSLDAGHVLDQSQQIGAGRRHRAADVVLRWPVELPEQSLAGGL